MQTALTITVAGQTFEILCMNVLRPILFQVFANIEGQKNRFHLKDVDGALKFAMREDVPKELVDIEEDMSAAILSKYL